MENNWTIEQTKALFDAVKSVSEKGEGLKNAFKMVAEDTKKSVNSVRNYYYAQLKMFELVPNLAIDLGVEIVRQKREGFELFLDREIDDLVRMILVEKGKGKSVRATIGLMAKDSKDALRLQNKYRSMVAHNKGRVGRIMSGLDKEGIVYFDPYQKEVVSGADKKDNLAKLSEYISRLDPGEVGNFLSILGKLSS